MGVLRFTSARLITILIFISHLLQLVLYFSHPKNESQPSSFGHKVMVNLHALRNQSACPRGFTRIELTAFIAAVLLIAGLALPGVARSNNGSSRAVCFNNLKQMGMAMTMYAADNRDYLAFCNWDSGNAPTFGWLYGPGAIPDPTSLQYSAQFGSAWRNGAWFKYIGDPNSYLCPLDLQSPYYRQRPNKLSSYVMNGAVCGFTISTYSTCKITQVWSPACLLLWEPDSAVSGAFEFNDGANWPGNASNESLATYHSVNGSEVLCVGGNVAFVSSNSFRAASFAVGKSLLWWSPFSFNGH